MTLDAYVRAIAADPRSRTALRRAIKLTMADDPLDSFCLSTTHALIEATLREAETIAGKPRARPAWSVRRIDPTPFPTPLKWWICGPDEGGCQGPFDTREAAHAAGEAERLGEDEHAPGEWRLRFTAFQARATHVDLARYFDAERWVETAHDAIDEDDVGADEWGERHPLEELSSRDIADLEASVRSAIRHWQERKGLRLKSSWLSDCAAHEEVTIRLDEEDEDE